MVQNNNNENKENDNKKQENKEKNADKSNNSTPLEKNDKEKEKEETNKNEEKEQILRLMAEFDNYKKRAKNDIDNAKIIGKAEFIKSMLPIIDEFDLALIAIEELKDANILKGVELLYSNFISQLKKEGLEETKSDGMFDPYKHEIIISKQSNKPYGTILGVIKKGYVFNGIMLRPAAVIISNGKQIEDNKNEKNNDKDNIEDNAVK